MTRPPSPFQEDQPSDASARGGSHSDSARQQEEPAPGPSGVGRGQPFYEDVSSDEENEEDASAPSFLDVVADIREINGIEEPPPAVPADRLAALSGFKKKQSRPSPSFALPWSKMAVKAWSSLDDKVSLASSSFKAKRATGFLQVPFPRSQRFYKPVEAPAQPCKTNPSAAEFAGVSLESLERPASKLTFKDLNLFETLSLNAMRVSSWLDLWLNGLSSILPRDDSREARKAYAYLESGDKAFKFLFGQLSSIYGNCVLRKRDIVRSSLERHLSKEDSNLLRNCPVSPSEFLFPEEVLQQVKERSRASLQDKAFLKVVLQKPQQKPPTQTQTQVAPAPAPVQATQAQSPLDNVPQRHPRQQSYQQQRPFSQRGRGRGRQQQFSRSSSKGGKRRRRN